MADDSHQNDAPRATFSEWIIVALLVIGVVLLFNHFLGETWRITFLDSSGRARITDKFGSKQACLDELHTHRYGNGAECGSNCKYSNSGIDIYHCKNTAD